MKTATESECGERVSLQDVSLLRGAGGQRSSGADSPFVFVFAFNLIEQSCNQREGRSHGW
ncbi:MAG: hypothetical protein ACRC8R_03010 [Aeromonas hydrophila]